MLDLIKAHLIKYLRSPLFYIALTASLATGIYGGVYFSYFAEEPRDIINCYADDMWMLTAIWAEIVLVAMSAGREFSDGTIRSKIIAGHTKARVFLAEVIAAAAVTVMIYLANIVPTAIGGAFFISGIPTVSAVKWFIDIFLTFEFMSIMAVAVTYLTAKRAIGVVAAFAVQFALYIIFGFTGGYYYNIGEPQMITSTYTDILEDGTVKEFEEEYENRYYTEGMSKILIQTEHMLNPISGLEDAVFFGYIPDKTKVEDYVSEIEKYRVRDLDIDMIKMLAYCIVLSCGGAYLFSKKGLK